MCFLYQHTDIQTPSLPPNHPAFYFVVVLFMFLCVVCWSDLLLQTSIS